MRNIDQNIFKSYDIRGIYPGQINEEAAYGIGRAYATWLLAAENAAEAGTEAGMGDGIVSASTVEKAEKLRVAVGSDMRTSSPALKTKIISALLDSGIDVDDIGMVSTPSFYFATAFYGYSGGIQVSASHNPKEWNGFKIVKSHAIPLSAKTGIFEIRDIILNEDFSPVAKHGWGVLGKKENVVMEEIKEQIDFAGGGRFPGSAIKKFKIAADASSGMGAADMDAIFSNLNCEAVKLNFRPDGNFPAHGADPMIAENTAQLRGAVLEGKCDLGIIADGDGDRYFFCDEKGEMIAQDILRGVLAEIELAENPHAVVAYDIRPGRITKDIIDSHGGKAIITPVGHSLIKAEMIEHGAVFGGESSGHFFYKLPYGTFEAPAVLIYKLLKFLSAQGRPVSECFAPYKKYFSSGEINMKVAGMEASLRKIAALKEKFADGKQNLIDGLSVEYPDFWFNLRASNTEPLIRFTLEARSPEIMAQKRDEILEEIRTA